MSKQPGLLPCTVHPQADWWLSPQSTLWPGSWAHLFQAGAFKLAKVSLDGASKEEVGLEWHWAPLWGSLPLSLPPVCQQAPKRGAGKQVQGAKAEPCQTSILICNRSPVAFKVLPTCVTASIWVGPGWHRAFIPWWAPDELASPITCTRNSWDMPKHKPCNYGVCVSKLDQTEPKGLTEALGDAVLHACLLKLPRWRGHCHEVESLAVCREGSWLPTPSSALPKATRCPRGWSVDGLRALRHRHPWLNSRAHFKAFFFSPLKLQCVFRHLQKGFAHLALTSLQQLIKDSLGSWHRPGPVLSTSEIPL